MMMSDHENNRVLIVDDQKEIHEDFTEMLQPEPLEISGGEFAASFLAEESPPPRRHFELLHARTGEDALAVVRSGKERDLPVALVYIDIRMPPGMDGIETIRRFRQVDRDVEIVIMTAYTDMTITEIVHGMELLHKVLYIRKPFTREEIQQMTLSLVEKWNIERRLEEKRRQVAVEHRRLDAVINATGEPIAMCDLDGRLVFANRNYERLLELPHGELKAMSPEALAARVDDRFREPRPSDVEGRFTMMDRDDIVELKPGDGVLEQRLFYRIVMPVRDGAGETLGSLYVYRDVSKEMEMERMKAEVLRLRTELQSAYSFEGIVGDSDPMRNVYMLMTRAAESDITVLIQGESGTGKELVAKSFHFHSSRKAGPFLAINCAAVPEALIESETSDGRDYRTREFLGHHGLDAISADEAYQRGYFGQDVTIAVADDGLDPTHPDLAGRITAPRHVRNRNANVFEPGRAGDLGTGHGTYVALLAAGARDNAGGTFEIRAAGGGAIPTYNVHGVAPQASIMPIQLAGGGQPLQAIDHAAANRAQVLNFSIGITQHYYGRYAGRDGVWLTVGKPLFRPLLNLDLVGRFLTGNAGEFARAARTLDDRDMVVVWAAGNESWNSINNTVHMCGKNFIGEDGCRLGDLAFTAQEFMENFSWLRGDDERGPAVSFKEMWGTECGSEDCADYDSIGGWMVAPLFESRLLGKWLVVGALDRHGRIARFSNGCGEARNWCLFAPGEGLRVGPNEALTGTSFAAPMVSGALAVLKSRLPGMPMSVVQAVLLYSADPLGSRVDNPNEPDAVYGWGRLNLGRAVAMQGTVALPFSVAGTARTPLLRDVRITLSPALAQVGERLQGVQVAVGGVGKAYYNTSLFDAVAVEAGGPPALGRAAGDMLAQAGGHLEARFDTHGSFAEPGRSPGELHAVGMDFSAGRLGRWRLRHSLCEGCERSAWREWSTVETAGAVAAAPFFAHAGNAVALQIQGRGLRPFAAVSSGRMSSRAPWRQFGLRWRQERDGFLSVAEVSRIEESRSVWGATFGALGDTRTRTIQNRLFLSTSLGGDWRGFAGYQHGYGDVSVAGGMLSGISGLRAEGWSAGTQRRNVFGQDDILRFAVRQETAVRGGHARFRHVVAAGSSFVDAFYRGAPQSLERQRTVIDLRARPTTRYAVGYSLPAGQDARIAFGLEYESESRDSGVSARLRKDF